MDLPLIAPVRQTQPQPAVANVPGEVRRQWLGSPLPKRLQPGARVAVGVGSRGIANILPIVKTSVDTLKEMGFRPFVVAAMGSHGGATAEGQRELLAEYGVTERELGVEVRTGMDTVLLGTNSWGEPVYWDRNAFEADGVVSISRIKPHTDFRGSFESGILKMAVIGLGKRDGAAQHHRWGLRGLRDMMPETCKVILEKTRFLGGLAILENAKEQTAHLQFVDRAELFDVEPKLLDQARTLMGRLPFEQLDVLIIGELGKNYSGAGIDPNVVGRLLVETAPEFNSPKITRVIFLTMNGGPSQVDTFDYKPALEKYAGQALPPGKKYINSGGRKVGFLTPNFRPFRPGGQSGLMISDYFPKVREHADKLAVIRSCHTDSHAHGSALVALNTGKTFIGRPSLGSWAVYGLGTENQDLPGYVVILDKRGGPISGQPNWSSGFMSGAYAGTLFRPVGDPILDLRGPAHLDRAAQRSQLDLLAKLNQEHLDARPDGRELATRIQSYELAYRMQSAAPEAVDLTRETKATLDLYGVGLQPTDEFGRNCLVARRLVERGVRFVQLYSGGGHLEETWDAHQSIEKNHGRHAAEVDVPIAGLLTDLQRRGLLESTLIVWGGEFGRMPFSEGKGEPGRNHNPYGFSVWFAGAGVKGGIAHGETDEFGFEAVTDRCHLHDLHATVLHLLGLDHEKLTYFHQGRDERLTDVYGRVVREILG